jgi:hypothetical protein
MNTSVARAESLRGLGPRSSGLHPPSAAISIEAPPACCHSGVWLFLALTRSRGVIRGGGLVGRAAVRLARSFLLSFQGILEGCAMTPGLRGGSWRRGLIRDLIRSLLGVAFGGLRGRARP